MTESGAARVVFRPGVARMHCLDRCTQVQPRPWDNGTRIPEAGRITALRFHVRGVGPPNPTMHAHPFPPVIQARLSDRLIGELPRFFGGRLPAFRELFQNAFRAGAKRVNITLEGQVLVVEDDGAGCPDPQLLLAAGTTGWDESKVVE